MAVARQELLDAQRAGAMIRADEHDVAEPVRDQLHAAQDEGAHEDLAQLAVGLHERQQLLAVQLDHLARRADARLDERAPAREHVDLAGELARSVDRDERLGDAGWPDDLDLARRHHEKRHDRRTRLDEHLAARIGRRRPCAAMRAICAGVSVGNIWPMRAVSVNGSGVVTGSVTGGGPSQSVRSCRPGAALTRLPRYRSKTILPPGGQARCRTSARRVQR